MGAGAADIVPRVTLNIGMIQGGLKVNMVPDHVRIEADIRLQRTVRVNQPRSICNARHTGPIGLRSGLKRRVPVHSDRAAAIRVGRFSNLQTESPLRPCCVAVLDA